MRVLIVRLGALGDVVHTIPAVAAIRRAFPDATIDWLIEPKHAEILRLVTAFNDTIPLVGRSAIGWLATRSMLRRRRYDVALDFQGLIKSAALARLSGAPRVIGFETDALRERAAAWFYREHIAVPADGHVILKNLRLAGALGAATGVIEFPLRQVASPALDLIRQRGVHRFALINPGAAWPNKRWPPQRLGEVAAHAYDRHGLASVILWGPGEQSLASAVVAASKGTAIEAPPTSVTDLAELSRAAELLISGDTGPLHIAAAVGTPVVAVFGPTDPTRNGPWASADQVVSRYDRCDCHYARECERTGAPGPCIETIAWREVADAIDRRLARMP